MAYIIGDLETTGLSPQNEIILEIAYDMAHGLDQFTEPMVTSFLVHHSARQLSYFYRNADPFVQKMHDDNGLWRDLVDNRLVQLSLTEIDDHMAGELSSYGEGPHYFVGNSIRLDRGFIELYLPRFASLLHYRQIDLSSTELMLQAKGKTSNGDKTGDHRAADDVLDSIKQLNRQLDLL